jgi:hypothetical protein
LHLRFVVVVALLAVLLAHGRSAHAANDPHLSWRTITTRHFRITYYSTEDEVAQHVATLAEAIYERLSPAVGWSPGGLTEVLLTDQTDDANGSATALPYNAVRLFVTAPDDMSPLGDVDDWYLELLTHEYTHILHTDHIGGLPALVNAILGKTLAPNQVEPHWLLEGLAVFEESDKTTGGRLRSSMWNMFMRADVLEDNVAPIDVFSNLPRRWPQGNLWYLYGSFFMKWIAETYGEQAIRHMIDDYGSQIVPFGVNRSIRRATGHTYEELFPAWIDTLRRIYTGQAAAIRARGLREGVRVTYTGNTAEHPRWLPPSAWPDKAGQIAYYVDDGHTRPGYWAVPLVRNTDGEVLGSREDRRELLIRSPVVGGLSFLPTGAAIYSSLDIYENLFAYDDLFELRPHVKDPTGLENKRIRWTDGARALDPSVSPDGRRVVFTTNHRGTTYLMMADVVPSSRGASAGEAGAHDVGRIRPLLPSPRFDQAYTPRWAPDNRHVAYSAWRRGGYRDVRIVDTNDGSYVELTHDRAIDGNPVYSADGRYLYFNSDRTGVMNVYAYELATGVLKQVTNAINGAYQPEPSPDGKSLAYIGYTHDGYDVFVIPLDPNQWLDALPPEDDRGAMPVEPPPALAVPAPYDPWPTLLPRAYSIQLAPGNFGQASTVTISGGDIAGIHGFALTLTTEWERPDFEPSFTYTYARLPFDVSEGISRTLTPQSNFTVGNTVVPYVQETVASTTSVVYNVPRAFDSEQFAISYTVARYGEKLSIPPNDLNPYDTPHIPTQGMLGSLHLGWGYSNAESYLWSVSSERGISVGASLDLADPALASDFQGYAASVNVTSYHLMPWLRHHVLALHAGGGVGGGNSGNGGPFYVGGFLDQPVTNVLQNLLLQGGVALRGYPLVEEVGSDYALFNAEYRFPIVNVDRGPSTLPVFLNRMSGNAFVDYGSAFDDPDTAKFKTGVGGELWFDFTLGYVIGFTFRVGHAKGLASDGIDKTYFIASVPY